MYKIMSKYFWKDLWYKQVDTRFRPRQKWLTDKIPRTFCDVDYLIETCVFESLISFWESDSGEETLRFQFECEYGEEYGMSEEASAQRKTDYREIYRRLNAAYNWAKARDKYIESSLDRKNMDEYIKAERRRVERDTFFLKEIIELRDKLWS